MKILLKGYYGFGNLGDDLLMLITFRVLKEKYPNASFFIFSNFNQNQKGFNREPDYNHYIYKLLDAKPELIDWTYKGKFDLLVDGGGGVYFDKKDGSRLSELKNNFLTGIGARAVSVIDKILRFLTLSQKRVKFTRRIGLGLGIGPYAKGSGKLYHDMIEIGSYDTLIVRDELSFDFLNTIQFAGNKLLFTDTAFLNQYWMPGQSAISHEKHFQGNIGIVLMDQESGNEALFSGFKKFADESAQKGYLITFFSMDENHDREYLTYFNNYDRFITWHPEEGSMQQFFQSLSMQDIIITGRAHGAIIGGQLGAVPICLGSSQKLVQVSKMFPSSSVLIHDPTDRAALHDSIEAIRLHYPEILQRLATDNLLNQNKAREALGVLRGLV